MNHVAQTYEQESLREDGTANKKTLKGYEEAINRLMKKVPEYQDLNLQEIKYHIRLDFKKRDSERKQAPCIMEATLDSLLDCKKYETQWLDEKVRSQNRMYDYCKVKIEAFYHENYKGNIISFIIPELSFEYDQT